MKNKSLKKTGEIKFHIKNQKRINSRMKNKNMISLDVETDTKNQNHKSQ